MAVPIALNPATRLGWLETESGLHEELDWLWQQNEARYEGGHRVWDELWRFDWETACPPRGRSSATLRDIKPLQRRTRKNKDTWLELSELRPGEHYARRQESSVYVNVMESFATDVVGTIFKNAPAPQVGLDFGTMGMVRRKEDIDKPSEAELIYYNVDGVGVDGSQWDSFWSTQLKLAMVTGFRLIFVEATTEPPRTQGRVRKGFRPFAVPFSPRSLWNHHYENGVLQWAWLKILRRKPQVVNGVLAGNEPGTETLLLVRAGNDDLGTEFKTGGWWRYDTEKELITRPDGTPATGNWDKTEGEIPMAPLFYDRHPEMFGRPALTELGSIGIAAMNLHSCADYDAFDGVGSVKALRGVDQKGYNLFIEKVLGGNKYAPLATNEETGKVPDMQDASQGQIVADVFDKRFKALADAVDRIKGTEVSSAPQASGLAQQAGFAMGNVPRLTLVAGNIETAQNPTIQWFEQRLGHKNPSGSARWPRKFELIKLTSSAQAVLQLLAIAGLDSEELETRVILAATQDEGFVPDNASATTIETELRTSVKAKIAQAASLAKAQQKSLTQPKTPPQIPGKRKKNMPPEPAGTNLPIKPQLDGPAIP